MKRWPILILFLALILVACGPATPAETPPVDDSEPPPTTENDVFLPDPTEEAYPAYPAAPQEPTPIPDEYPAPEIPLPTPESYPAAEGEVWVIRPVGEQCAEPESNEYANLQEAVEALAAAGATVNESETINLIVCEACGCPTSAHFRAQINAANLGIAQSLGWQAEE